MGSGDITHNVIIHKTEVALYNVVSEFNLSEKDLIRLEEAIEDYGNYKYCEGSLNSVD